LHAYLIKKKDKKVSAGVGPGKSLLAMRTNNSFSLRSQSV
jgi:hypothetical protein